MGRTELGARPLFSVGGTPPFFLGQYPFKAEKRCSGETMPIDTDDARLDQARFIALYLKLAQVQLGTLANTYDYHSIRRLIRVSGDDIEAEGEDPLGDRIVEGIHALPSSETDGGSTLSIDPPASMAALFQEHELARSLKPKLYVGFDLQDGAAVCGMLTTCSFERDPALSTSRFTQGYCSTHHLPRFEASWTLVDVVASSKHGTGALLLLNAVVGALRAKKAGILSIAVTKAGRRLFESFGFATEHSWRERGGQRYLCYARTADVKLTTLHSRLRVHNTLLSDVCFRNGLTNRTMHHLIGRC